VAISPSLFGCWPFACAHFAAELRCQHCTVHLTFVSAICSAVRQPSLHSCLLKTSPSPCLLFDVAICFMLQPPPQQPSFGYVPQPSSRQSASFGYVPDQAALRLSAKLDSATPGDLPQGLAEDLAGALNTTSDSTHMQVCFTDTIRRVCCRLCNTVCAHTHYFASCNIPADTLRASA
jgi:hypothetical protein